MPIATAAKSKISIGTTTAMANVAAYVADTWVLIPNVLDMGEMGAESEIITAKFIEATVVRKLKGSRDNGTLELKVARDSQDTGWLAMTAAEKTSFGYNFKVELNDKPAAGASPKNSFIYFNAIVASAKNSLADADNIVVTTFSLAITSEILEVAASAT